MKESGPDRPAGGQSRLPRRSPLPGAEIPCAPRLARHRQRPQPANRRRRVPAETVPRPGARSSGVSTFNRQFIALAGPEANRSLERDDAHFRTSEVWQAFDGELSAMRQIMSMSGVEHAQMRSRTARPTRSTSFGGTIRGWPDDAPVPVQHVCQRIVLEQLGRLATGMSPGIYLDDIIVFFDTLLAVHFAGSRPGLALHRPRVRRARRRVLGFARRIVAEHASGRRPDRPPDYVDDVMALHRNDPRFLPETDPPVTVLGPFLVGLELRPRGLMRPPWSGVVAGGFLGLGGVWEINHYIETKTYSLPAAHFPSSCPSSSTGFQGAGNTVHESGDGMSA